MLSRAGGTREPTGAGHRVEGGQAGFGRRDPAWAEPGRRVLPGPARGPTGHAPAGERGRPPPLHPGRRCRWWRAGDAPRLRRPEVMREALARNPDWQTLAVVQVQGQGLLEHVDRDVTIV